MDTATILPITTTPKKKYRWQVVNKRLIFHVPLMQSSYLALALCHSCPLGCGLRMLMSEH